jgi:S1-C subfamily serine protease
MLQVERAGGDPALGLALSAGPAGGVLVAGVRPGSVADRCGALHVGDLLLAVAGTRVDEGLGPMEAAQLLAQSGSPVLLQVLPQQRWGSVESGLSRGEPTCKLLLVFLI